MKKAESFEDLVVWQKARELTKRVYEITKDKKFSGDFSFIDQIRRAAVSVISNISEGFERGSNTEFIQFLFLAKGSCGEVRCQMYVAYDQWYITKEDFNTVKDSARQVSGMLGNFIEYLKGSELKGTKFKTPPRKSWAEESKEILQRIMERQGIKPRGAEDPKA
ncbi:MAG TPA: four helix bundle protein [Candidatus Hypogeohydataceae bacterium YC41]